MLDLGGIERSKEECRDMRKVNWVHDLIQDLRYGVRMLVKNPGFTAVAVLTLALGVGANTAVFSVVNGVLLRPLPFHDPAQLVVLGELNPRVSPEPVGASFLNFTDWAQENHVFEQVAAYRGRRMTLVGKGEAQRIAGIGTTASMFPMLGARAHLGRTLIPEDEKGGQGSVVVISYGLWQRLFGGDPAAIGQTLNLDNAPRTVVGVLPPDFRFLQNAEFFTALEAPASLQQQRGIRFLRVLARLKPGFSLAQAQMDMDVISLRLAKEHGRSNEGWSVSLVALQDKVVGRVRLGLLIVLGTVGFVLLIACANVANLLLSRSVGRQREIAIRVALGAGRGRVFRQLLTESLLLSMMGSGIALLWAIWGVEGLRALAPPDLPRIEEISLDGGVLGFTLVVAVLTGLLFGAAPAWQAARVQLQDSIKEGARWASQRHSRLRTLLVVAEVALSLVALVGAGLLGRSLVRLLAVEPGFDSANLLTFDVRLPQYKYGQEFQQVNFFCELLDRAQSVPGVRSAALTLVLPLSGGESKNSFSIEGRPQEEAEWANLQVISAGYFRTMGIPLLHGRAFVEQDTRSTPQVAIINEGMARKYWPNEAAVGKRLLFGGTGPDAGPMVIGVVGNVKQADLTGATAPEIYLPYQQQPGAAMTVVVRTEGNPKQLTAPLRGLVRSLDPDQPIERVQTMEDLLARAVAVPRNTALLMGIFSMLSLMLVAVGIYSVISYSVSQRTQEIGVRMALGAQRGEIFRMVVRQSLWPTFLGVALGLGGALGLTRWLARLLFEVHPADPVTFSGVTVLLTLVAVAACYTPARRATRVDPMVALRHE
jgi:putative ABC transport system permease protein